MNPVEPISLAALGGATLTQGVQFLYAQASEILRRRRDREEAIDEPVEIAKDGTAALDVPPQPRPLDPEQVDRLEPFLRRSTEALEPFVKGERPLDTGNLALLSVIDGLRQALEGLLDQRLTLQGERRVEVAIDAERISGYIAGIEADYLDGSSVKVSIKAKDSDATIIGIRKLP